MTDMHAETALRLYGEVTRETRAKAKIINFLDAYGTSDLRMAHVAGRYPVVTLPRAK